MKLQLTVLLISVLLEGSVAIPRRDEAACVRVVSIIIYSCNFVQFYLLCYYKTVHVLLCPWDNIHMEESCDGA